MFNTIESLNAIYVIILSLSALSFLYLRTLWSAKVPEIFFWIHFTIVSWSALMYLNLVFTAPIAPFTYYADWIVSTPLIMLALGLTAMYPLDKIQWNLLFPLMMIQAMIVVTGLLAQISLNQTSMLCFFGFGNVLMFIIFYLVFGPIMQLAKTNKLIFSKYKKLALLLIAFWVSYPLIWIIGTPGYGLVSPYVTNLLFIILPILCKPVFGFIDLYIIQSLKPSKLKS
jgi:bacteriorhodopsin